MVKQSPKIDPRTAADIEQQVQELLSKYVQDWSKLQLASKSGKVADKGISVALIKIFARYCEIIIERLNKVPQKNFLAFLDLLGASHLPSQSARVPLTFSLSDKSTVDAVVPKGTQVAAQLTAGEKQPVIFETENDLVVTAAKLESIFLRDLPQKIYGDYSTIVNISVSNNQSINVPAFRGNQHLEDIFQFSDLVIEKAFTNQSIIDLSNSFFPFGEQPKFGDTLYLSHLKVFSHKDVEITLKFQLINPANYSNETGIAEIKVSENFQLQWEFWNGKQWQRIAINEDTTNNFRNFATETHVKFQLNEEPEKTKINNIENFWIRIRIIAGKYDASAPPIISSMKVSYKLTKQEEQIRATEGDKPSLYFGFTLPPNCKEFPQKPISLFVSLSEPKYGDDSVPLSPTQSGEFDIPKPKQPQLSWQYWDGKDWATITVSDATENFTRPGVITFLPPKDFALREDFGLLLRYWLRVRWKSGDYLVEPKLRRVLLNTVMATQAVTIRNEILGSSDGSENQKFRTTRMPVLRGQHLEVRESEMPSAQDQENIKRDEGDDAITPLLDANERPTKEYWVRWHEVPDFYGSGPRDRHYVINHLTGEIQFGNGRNGLIPSLSKNNIRMAYYQTGGGEAGNKPAGTIAQLKTTIPYVNRVTNYEAATGGAEAETVDALIERIPRRIRHHDRAVTLEDYEDLARLASAEVARAKCVPLRNLAANPLDDKELPGAVSVIIMPHSTDAKPLPSLELISRVQNYLEVHADPTASINVVGPLYVRVNITAELALSSLEGAAAVEQSVEQKLASFLHPLTGGFDGTGWDFGREPYKSDFYRLLESVPGVDHVRYLQVEDIEDKVGAKGTKRFLVYSGKHDISPTFTQA